MQRASLKVEYQFRDGWHVFSSEEMPGLYIASKDPEAAYEDVPEAIKLILKEGHGLTCEVTRDLTLAEFLRHVGQNNQVESAFHAHRMVSQRFAVSACH